MGNRDYSRYRDGLLVAGFSTKEMDELIGDMQREDELLDKLVCPKCGGQLTRSCDGRQSGCSQVPGNWNNYRCACGFMLDRVDPVSDPKEP